MARWKIALDSSQEGCSRVEALQNGRWREDT
jgi:hypothetical protein